jgi:hypothetical protein
MNTEKKKDTDEVQKQIYTHEKIKTKAKDTHEQKAAAIKVEFKASTSSRKKSHLQHNNTHTTTLSSVDLILGINARRYICGTVVEEVVVQLTVSRAEFLVDEEERVVEECEGVEDVEFSLFVQESLVSHSRG